MLRWLSSAARVIKTRSSHAGIGHRPTFHQSHTCPIVPFAWHVFVLQVCYLKFEFVWAVKTRSLWQKHWAAQLQSTDRGNPTEELPCMKISCTFCSFSQLFTSSWSWWFSLNTGFWLSNSSWKRKQIQIRPQTWLFDQNVMEVSEGYEVCCKTVL